MRGEQALLLTTDLAASKLRNMSLFSFKGVLLNEVDDKDRLNWVLIGITVNSLKVKIKMMGAKLESTSVPG